MRIKSITTFVAFGLGVVLSSPSSAETADNGLGVQSFAAYCANCHGENALGDGPLSRMLSVEVPDLTQLSANNDGVFPMLHVIQTIDGRSGLRAHDVPMPTYGEVFAPNNAGPYGAEAIVRGRMLSIALYLESIQK